MRAHDLFTQITNQLIADIEAGAGTWRMPWYTLADTGTPESVDGRRYSGTNALWLALVGADREWTSGTWATYPAWQRHGAQVRRGEKATPVLLWKPTTAKRPDRDDGLDDDTDPATGRRLVARVYSVFSAEQVDGADELLARRAEWAGGRDSVERIAAADAYLNGFGVEVIEGGDRACYLPDSDTIRLPTIDRFRTPASYYATRAHETVHATGHPSRLARTFGQRFGDRAYAAEELVAELGAAMWCAQAGISSTTRTDHAAYLSHWLDILRDDPRSLVTVAGKAQAAVDYITTHTTHPLPEAVAW
ncbi:MAG TPA: zincin-like metallopeptidase domain-containing protein [Acidimicrobiales bacterium]|jgi:antirestriction protein ArdC|nr:zincin-like metallopeptidase domain-containing protein [Acidimicrobiales bacterium]